MENGRGSSRAQSGSNTLRYLWLAPAALLFSAVVSVPAFIGYAASKLPSRPSPHWLIHPAVIYSPFTLHRGIGLLAVGNLLKIPIHPSAAEPELGTFGWSVKRQSESPTPAGLVVLSFEVNAPVAGVNSWYRTNFPKPYSELRGQQIPAGLANERWFQRLDARIDDETHLYQAADSSGTRGAVVEPLSDPGRTKVTLFYYSEGR